MRKYVLYCSITWLIGCVVLIFSHSIFLTSSIKRVYGFVGMPLFMLNMGFFALEWSHLIDIQKARGVHWLWRGSFFANDRKTLGDEGVRHRNWEMLHFLFAASIILMTDYIL